MRARRTRKIAFRLGLIVFWLCVFVGSVIAGLVIAAVPDLPRIEGSRSFQSKPGTVLARDGVTVLRTLRSPTSRTYVNARDIPASMQHAVVAAEDRRFYQHRGVDPFGLARAAWVDLRSGKVEQGGSTITQQLVKNTYAGTDRTAARKSREAIYALALETKWSKQRILTAYLNTVYFGNGAYGIRDASKLYFGKRPQQLGIAESALLAAMLRAPERSNPLRSPDTALLRRAQVLQSMHDLHYITSQELAQARTRSLPTPASIQRRRNAAGNELAPHFTDAVLGKIISEYGVNETLGSGLRITTTLDPRIQQAARAAMRQIDGTKLGASVAVINAHTGEVLALANGGAAASSAFDVATNGHRQPGSAFKPFALTAALRAGMTPRAQLVSAPYHTRVNGKVWRVTNDGGYAGKTTLQQATWKSDNTAYARLTERIGVDAVIAAARNAGITSRIDPVPATTLGGLPDGVTPLELARAYATFANHGSTVNARGWSPMIQSAIHPKLGDLARIAAAEAGDSYTSSTTPIVRSIERPIADEVTDLLRGVVQHGTGTAASIGRPVAGKTGTSEHNVDAWFVGYTPDIVAAVWVGHPEGAIPMRHEFNGGPVFGGTYPARIWHDLMQAVTSGQPVHAFSLKTPSYVSVLIDPANGLRADVWCATAVSTEFIAGREPSRSSTTCASATRRLPNVVGMDAVAARALLDAAGFTWTEQVLNPQADSGQASTQLQVTSQTPAAGTKVTRDRQITLVIGPAPAPAPTPTPAADT